MRTILATLAAAALAGCGGAPFEYHSQREIPRGPGMFSGEEGAFVLRAKDVPAASPAAAPGDLRELQDYREFRRWKDSGAGADEQREFREWREWREWKRRHAQPAP